MIKILVVDDEKELCAMLKDFFKVYGFSVLTATSAKEALAQVEKQSPKIVFLDVRMPEVSGFEVLKEIKKRDKAIKVIMVTAMDDEETAAEAKKLGADEFITKPFTTDYLEKVVAKKIEELLKERGKKMAGHKILVVDDEVDVRERLANILSRKLDCKAQKAESGEKALELLKKTKFDLVLIDIKMPGLSGIDVIREAAKFTPETKFLAISAYDSAEVANGALEAGAVDFLHKPISPEAVELKVKDILGI